MDNMNLLFVLFLTATAMTLEDDGTRYNVIMVKKQFKRGGEMRADARTYRELVEGSDKFIDKTSFIHKLHEFSDDKVIKLTCPPHWGKSMSLQMLKTFYELELHENMTQILPELAPNFRLFMHSEVIHKNGEVEKLHSVLTIGKYPEFIHVHQGIYPVILIGFENITATTYGEFINQFNVLISDVFKTHGYLDEVLDCVSYIGAQDREHDDDQNNQPDEQNQVNQDQNQDHTLEPNIQNQNQTNEKNETFPLNQTESANDTLSTPETTPENKDNLQSESTPDDNATQTETNHEPTEESTNTNETHSETTSFTSTQFYKFLKGKANASELIDSIWFLSKLLHKYFDQKVIILIDDYDCVFKLLLLNDIPKEEGEKIRKFYTSFLISTLHSNKYMEKSLITGTYDVRSFHQGVTSTLMNTSLTILHNPCGFTGFELDHLVRSFPIDKEVNRKARQWYNGYRNGRRLSIYLYEMEPMIHTYNSGTFAYHPLSNAIDFYIRKSLEVKRFRGIIANIISGKSYTKSAIHNDHSIVLELKKIPLKAGSIIVEEERRLYLTLLYGAGYFALRKNNTGLCVAVPNQRTKYKLAEFLMDYYREKYNVRDDMIDNVIKNFYNFMVNDTDDSTSFIKALHEFFQVFPLNKDIFEFHLLKYVFHYFALHISLRYEFRLLEMRARLDEPIVYIAMYSPQRRIILGVKETSILTERMIVKLHSFENHTTLAPVSNYTKIIALAIPPFGEYKIHHLLLKNC